jgi:hypothetical protein
MPEQNKTKTKQDDAKHQAQKSYLPAGSKVIRPDALDLGDLQPPDAKHGDEPDSAQGTNAGHNQPKAAKPFGRVEKLNIALTLFFSFWVVVFTGISTYYSSKQWEGMRNQLGAMSQQLKQAEETRAVENRAYLSVQEVRLDTPIRAGIAPSAHILYVNNGKTPAVNARASFCLEVVDNPLHGRLTFQGCPGDEIQIALLPGSPTRFIPTRNRPLSDEEVRGIVSDTKRLYIWGFVEYMDMFGVHQRYEFCNRALPGKADMAHCPASVVPF